MVLGSLLQAFGGCCCFCVCYTMSTAVAFAIHRLPLCVCYRCYCLFATISAAAKVRRILCVPSASCNHCGIGGAFSLRSSCLRHYSCIGSTIRAFMFRCVLLQLLVHAVVPMLLVLLPARPCYLPYACYGGRVYCPDAHWSYHPYLWPPSRLASFTDHL